MQKKALLVEKAKGMSKRSTRSDNRVTTATVRVRILVATDRKGRWLAYGFPEACHDTEMAKQAMALDNLESGEIYHWVEADVPLPAETGPAIEGTVQDVENGLRELTAERDSSRQS
jgi:hypothetical protein